MMKNCCRFQEISIQSPCKRKKNLKKAFFECHNASMKLKELINCAQSCSQGFREDSLELPFTDILIGFDNRKGFPCTHYSLFNTPTSMLFRTKPKFFVFKNPKPPGDISAQSRRRAFSYTKAIHLYNLRNQYRHPGIAINFIRFKQNNKVEHYELCKAPRGWWVFIYIVLKVLATISIDSPNLPFKEGAQYCLSPQMNGIVPWRDRGGAPKDHSKSLTLLQIGGKRLATAASERKNGSSQMKSHLTVRSWTLTVSDAAQHDGGGSGGEALSYCSGNYFNVSTMKAERGG